MAGEVIQYLKVVGDNENDGEDAGIGNSTTRSIEDQIKSTF